MPPPSKISWTAFTLGTLRLLSSLGSPSFFLSHSILARPENDLFLHLNFSCENSSNNAYEANKKARQERER